MKTSAVSLPTLLPLACEQTKEGRVDYDSLEADMGAKDPSLLPVPIALMQDPAPVDLDMLVTTASACKGVPR